MTDVQKYYALPEDLADDIEEHADDVKRYLAGELPAAMLKAKRVPRGIYEQRQDGTFMVRVRVAGGTLSGVQARELAGLAAEFGNSLLHVTSRQDVQLHDIDIADTPGIMRRLLNVGLTSKGGGGNTVRNVTACPYAGICPCERFDVTPYAHAVTQFLIALKGSYNLPRKYKIAFSGCSTDCALARINDLGFIADVRNGKRGFKVYAGGGMGARSRPADVLEEWVPASEAIRIAETIRRLFDRMGDRHNRHKARLRYVFQKIGLEAFRDAFHEELDQVKADGVQDCTADAAIVNASGATCCGPGGEGRSVAGLRVLAQRQPGFVAVPLRLPLGFLHSSDFVKLADIADTYSAEKGLRTSRFQDLLIRFVAEEQLKALADDLRSLQENVIEPAPIEHFLVCAGASTCRLGLCMSRPLARACAKTLEARGVDLQALGDPVFSISGCPNACGQHPAAEIGFFGGARRVGERLVPSYRVMLGARNTDDGFRLSTAVGRMPAREIPDLLASLLEEFGEQRAPQEAFVDFVDRVGFEHFKQRVGAHTDIPSYDQDPNYYRDWGQDCDFTLAGRGAGECGAGVFEVVQQDIATARKTFEHGAPADPDALFDGLLAITRALLITRGVETQDPDTVLREFENHFIDTGLVDSHYRALLTRARGYLEGWQSALENQFDSILALQKRIELLYSTMDAKLQFHPPGEKEAEAAPAATEASPSPPAGEQTDLRGVACPMNFVKAKLKLESLNIDDTLTILLDAGEPIQNVPASFRNEGQEVQETTDLGDGHWRLVIRKKK